MANVRFTPNMQRQLDCPDVKVAGKTVAEVMAAAFKGKPQVRAFFLNDNGSLKTHVAILVDGIPVKDRDKQWTASPSRTETSSATL